MNPGKVSPFRSLSELEAKARGLEPAPEAVKIWTQQLAHWANEFCSGLPKGLAVRVSGEMKAFNWKDSSFKKSSTPFSEIMSEATGRLLDHGVNTASGKFFGYVPGGGLPAAAFGDFIAALSNRYAGVYAVSPGAAGIENEVIRWLCDLIYGETVYKALAEPLGPDAPWGTLTSSGSIANLIGILSARETVPITDWSKCVIYHTDQAHMSISRAIRIAGLSQVERCLVSTDSNLRMDPVALNKLVQSDLARGKKPWLIITSAGTTNTGAIDPIAAISEIAKNSDCWLHVDAAYGGMFRLTHPGRLALGDLCAADSIALDPHKGLFMPYGCGAVLVKKRINLSRPFMESADYLEDCADPVELSPADYSPELTRHFRGMRVWFSLKVAGLDAFEAALEEKLCLAQLAYDEMTKVRALEVFEKPQLSVLAFRVHDDFGGEQSTRELLKEILKSGNIHLSSTRLQGRYYLRLCILNFRSHQRDVEAALNEIRGLINF